VPCRDAVEVAERDLAAIDVLVLDHAAADPRARDGLGVVLAAVVPHDDVVPVRDQVVDHGAEDVGVVVAEQHREEPRRALVRQRRRDRPRASGKGARVPRCRHRSTWAPR
jgi:hypothetical protein